MAFARLSRLLSAAAFLAGGTISNAATLPVSQLPQTHGGTANVEQSDSEALWILEKPMPMNCAVTPICCNIALSGRRRISSWCCNRVPAIPTTWPGTGAP